MKNSKLKWPFLLVSLLIYFSPDIEAQNLEIGTVHQDCMWFTCYKSKYQSHMHGGSPYWDYIAEFNKMDEPCFGDHPHILPDFVEFEGLKYRVVTAYTLPWGIPNRMMEKLHFSAYNGLTSLYIPEESSLKVGDLPDLKKAKFDVPFRTPAIYAPRLKSLNCDGLYEVSDMPCGDGEELDDYQRSILGRHNGLNHLRVACVRPNLSNSIDVRFHDCPELKTLIVASPEPPQFDREMFFYNDNRFQTDGEGRRYYNHPDEQHIGCSDWCIINKHCTLAGANERIYVIEIPEKRLVVPVGSLEKYKNAPGWSEFGEIIEAVDFEGIPLYRFWIDRLEMTEMDDNMKGKSEWIHEDDWREWSAMVAGQLNLDELEWGEAPYFIQDGIIYYENTRGEAEIVGPVDRTSSTYSFSDYVTNNFGRSIPVTKIRGYAFANFEHLNKDVVPSTVREIGNYAFYNAELDERFNHGGDKAPIACYFENVKKVGKYAFAECRLTADWTSNYINSYPDQPKIEWVGAGAFQNTVFYEWGNERSWNILLPGTIEHIGQQAFLYVALNYRPRTIKLPESLKYTGRDAFEWGACLDLSDYTAQEIPYEMFGSNGYGSSKSYLFPTNPITIPESVRTIYGRNGDMFGEGSYYGGEYTRSSAKITLGANVENIQPYSFTLKPGQDGIARIYLHSQNPPLKWDDSLIRGGGEDFEVEVHVPVGSEARYIEDGWLYIGKVIGDIDFLEIESGAFSFDLNMVDRTATLKHTDREKYRSLNPESNTLEIPGVVTYNDEDYEVKTIGSWATGDPTDYHAWSTIVLPETIENIEPFAFPFSFSKHSSSEALVCHAQTPPNIEEEHSFGWPYPVDIFTVSRNEKYGNVYVKDEAVSNYTNHKQFNSLFRVLPMSDRPTGIESLRITDLDLNQTIDIYTIDGMMLESGLKDISSLPKGLYIIRQRGKSFKVRI